MNLLRTQDACIEPRLDVDELSERCLGRFELVDKVLRRFHQVMDQELGQLQDALHATDLNTIAGIAHRIKGTSLTVAAHGLRDCAERLEAAVQADCLAGIEDSVAMICAEWTCLSDIISTCSLRADQ